MRKWKPDYSWVVLISCALFTAIGLSIQFSFGLFFKSLSTEFDISRTSTSAILSLFMVLSPLFNVMMGWLLDRYGPALAITLVGIFNGLSLILTSQVSELWQLFITYSLLLAIGSASVFVVGTSTVSRWFVQRRGLAMGLVASAGSMGLMVMSPVSAYLIVNVGWQTSYLILGLVALFGITPLALLYIKSPCKAVTSQVSDDSKVVGRPSVGKQAYSGTEGMLIHQAMATARFWLILFIWSLCAVCAYIIMTHIIPHATDLGIEPTRAALILTFFNGANGVGRVTMGMLSDSVGRKWVIVANALIMAGSMFWLIRITDFWSLCLFASIFGFTQGAYTTVLVSLIGDTFAGRGLGMIMSVLHGGWWLGGALGSGLGGYVFDNTGNYNLAFLAGGVCVLIGMGLTMAFKQKPGSA